MTGCDSEFLSQAPRGPSGPVLRNNCSSSRGSLRGGILPAFQHVFSPERDCSGAFVPHFRGNLPERAARSAKQVTPVFSPECAWTGRRRTESFSGQKDVPVREHAMLETRCAEDDRARKSLNPERFIYRS